MRCSVCTEPYTIELRKRIDCNYCDFKACSQCHQRYLLDTPQDAHCMSCRNGWTRKVLCNNFTNVFVDKRYKQHRENVLLERERGLMPETQPFVEMEIKCRKIEKDKDSLMTMRTQLLNQQTQMLNADLNTMGVENENWVEARIERYRRSQEFAKKIGVVNADIQTAEYAIGQYRNPNYTPKGRVVTFVRPCPADGCKGFLSTAWKCGLCDVHVCATCHNIKDLDEHACDPEAVATADLMRRDTKNCPKCGAGIFKINGCDQMYCTQCHTPFSWRTGQIVSGTIHNPHYYEYLRRTQGQVPRAAGDIVCGGLPDYYQFVRISRVSQTQNQSKMIMDIHRNIGHVQFLTNHRYGPTNYVGGNRDLRTKFMLNELTEDEFKKKIQQREKAENKKRDIREVLVTYTTVATDIFQKYMSQEPSIVRTDFYVELENLREYVQGLLIEIERTWKCSPPKFSTTGYILGEHLY